MTCGICGASDARFVRDHNHKTGFIRGILCELCNSWLGVLENHPYWYVLRKGRGKWRNWVRENAEAIYVYLNAPESKIRYRRKIRLAADCIRLGIGA